MASSASASSMPSASAASAAASSSSSAEDSNVIQEVLPKAGLVYSERTNLGEVLCKPKIMPIKSFTLEKMEQMERDASGAAAAEEEAAMGGEEKEY